MPASDSGATYTGGRRPKAAKERTRGRWGAEKPRTAMGIDAEVRDRTFEEMDELQRVPSSDIGTIMWTCG